MSENREIPKGWATAIFENLLNFIQPTKFIVASTEYDDKNQIPVLTAGKSFILGKTNESNNIFNEIPVIIFDDFTTATKFVNFPFKVKSSAMKILSPVSKLVNIKYLFCYMQTLHINAHTHKRYWISHYSKLPVPLPPLLEQHRIVAKIEELFSELDKGVEALKTAQQQLKVYRQAVLKWAFEGKLTEEWRKQQKNLPTALQLLEQTKTEREKQAKASGKRLKPIATLTEAELYDLPMLPEEWCWTRMGTVAEACLGKMLDAEKNKGIPKPYLRNSNVRWGAFDISDLQEMKFEDGEDERYGIKRGDLIVCEGGEPGRAAIWNEQIPNMKIQKALHRVRFNKIVLNKYALFFLILSSNNGHLDKYFTGTTIKHLPGEKLEIFSFPLCSLNEQRLIVESIETRLSVADKLEETITQSLQQAEALRQSILKKAFAGKLVPQDPNDEPASKLLERIKAEKATRAPVKRAQ